MDALSSIDHRIGQIHQLIASLSPHPTSSAGMAASGLTGTLASSPSSFSDLLATYQSGSVSMADAAAQLNANGVPRSLAGYGNGHIPESALAPINGSSERMWAPAAQQLNRLIADAKASGVTIGITDGYRSYDSQVRVAQEKGLYTQGGTAAQPGTSQHGWGLAVDLGLDPNAQAWMRSHAKDYGFVENVPREPWHWEFQPGKA